MTPLSTIHLELSALVILPEPAEYPPPCGQNSTGRCPLFAIAFGLVNTLRKRQSSVNALTEKALLTRYCAHMLPNAEASRTPVHGAGGTGGFQRRLPTGGAAYG